MSDQVLASMQPSQMRRVFAAAALGGLGVMLIWLAVSTPAALGLQVVLALVGAGALVVMQWLWRATDTTVELTSTELLEGSGRVIAPVSAIKGVERGPFAFKPSNGFLVHLNTAQPRHWSPGLWWRMGKSIGVGGVTSGHEGKAMAEAITMLVVQRD